jgi:hypothetical protein
MKKEINMTNIQLIIVILLTLLRIETYSQKAHFNYETDLCSCEGIFDSTKYSRTQLQNTLNYLWNSPNIHTSATATKLEKVKELSIEKLNIECNKRLQELNSLDFINTKFWTQVKTDRIREIESTCLLRQFTILAWENPDTLLSYNVVDSTCIFYRNALINGGQEMIKAWLYLNELMKSKNADPEKVQRNFDERFNSKNKIDYARLELLTFGWWNNANHLIFHLSETGEFELEFKNLFIKVKCECDEP